MNDEDFIFAYLCFAITVGVIITENTVGVITTEKKPIPCLIPNL